MTSFAPRSMATGVGSLPHASPQEALRVVFRDLAKIPFWPQLPRRDFRENMYVQFSQDLPGVKIDLAHEWIGAVTGDSTLAEVEAFYARYLQDDPGLFAVGRDYAAGLYALCDMGLPLKRARCIKGQVTGPISFGLKVTDQNLRPVLYDDVLRDVLVKQIARKARWQENMLLDLVKRPFASGSAPHPDSSVPGLPTLTFVDEPSLALIGASVVALNPDEVVRDLEEVYSAIQGLKGTHCCGNTDWGLLLRTSVDVISFDAYSYAENLALFGAEVKRFLDRGGAIAWGIVPTVEEQIDRETAEHLVERLDSAMELLVKKGIDRDLLYGRAYITPACGLGTISPAAAERALALAHAVSDLVRGRECLDD